jgi:hypothetical protein
MILAIVVVRETATLGAARWTALRADSRIAAGSVPAFVRTTNVADGTIHGTAPAR